MTKNCLLIGVNAKYIHTNLAIRYLKAYCQSKQQEIQLMEFSINDNIDKVLKEIFRSENDVYGFSCYIWNVDMVLKLCSSLKKLKPNAVIILGGPEVSFDADELMTKHEFIDYIVRGEGEETLQELLQQLESDITDASRILGLTYRIDRQTISNPDRPLLQKLDIIPFPYEDIDTLQNKIIYYETSRGCPFSCQYCLSSVLHGVRYLSMDRIKREISYFIEKGVPQVKLVDRTFNCNKRHSLEIINFILEQNSKTNFHFEIGADLLDEEIMAVLSKAPLDMFQFEIGVQSTNEKALREISRAMNLDKLKANVVTLQQAGNSHMHLDLIAGLPFEDLNSFANSFDEVHQLMPDMLQLGFLKLLKGSGIRKRAQDYGIEFNDFSPYEVLKTNWISYEELVQLKEIEHLLELYYNSGRFKNSLNYLFDKHYTSYFRFYKDFADYWKNNGLYNTAQSTRELYNILLRFTKSCKLGCLGLLELIKLDWLLYFNNGNMPEDIKRFDHSKVKNLMQEYIRKNHTFFETLLPSNALDNKNIFKLISFEVFFADVLNNPDNLDDHVIFYYKTSHGETKTTSKKLSEIFIEVK